MNIIVTGGAGFIGVNFVRYWLEHHPDDEIVIVDALTYASGTKNLYPFERDKRVRFLHTDICSRDGRIDAAVANCDIIVHFAAETHVDNSIVDCKPFFETNVMGTLNMLQLALQHGVRFHHISTDEVFGQLSLTSSERFSEATPYNPRNPYSASKAAADHVVRAFHATYGLPVTISNCSNNFGPYQHLEKMIPKIIANLLTGKPVPVYGDGVNVRDWLYVDDHCRAIELILLRGRIGETYCVGGMTEDVTNLDLVKIILEIMGKGEECISFVRDRPGHDLRYAIDWSKIHRELGYQPQHDFRTSLKKTVQWYTRNRSWWSRRPAVAL